jgi:hypothetical protein
VLLLERNLGMLRSERGPTPEFNNPSNRRDLKTLFFSISKGEIRRLSVSIRIKPRFLMAIFTGEVGLQFTTHIANHYTVPQWIELAQLAHKNNFDQVWVNDNLGYRNVFVILTAIASRVPIKLGTAILVPYFRNPVDAADAFAPSRSSSTAGRLAWE